jgi:hypothetical protein
MEKMRPKALPSFPPISNFNEINIAINHKKVLVKQGLFCALIIELIWYTLNDYCIAITTK